MHMIDSVTLGQHVPITIWNHRSFFICERGLPNWTRKWRQRMILHFFFQKKYKLSNNEHTQWSRRCQAPKVKNAAFSSKIDFVLQVQNIKIASLDTSYGVSAELADSAYWWSCIGYVLHLQPVQQACFLVIYDNSKPPYQGRTILLS